MSAAANLAVDIVIDNYNYAQFLGEQSIAPSHRRMRRSG